ncbi:PAS domain S-box protein [Paucibacter sp. B2R-40]|uniref:PAS domain S-box protein n=1 Tax=Paucibacter sp. B2R-40 TaxID=2893554 RepID=UPI0021E38C53|nr:PAS domain S-box protein [Paucibacter sp. B2R-40]MCV2357255.1 PAS domain S-box protein [Paucibacter sp. B2R-40]
MSQSQVSTQASQMEAFRYARLRHWLAYWPAILTALGAICLSFVLLWARESQNLASEQAQINHELSAIRTRLEAVAQATFSPTVGLEAMIQLDGGISSARFDALSRRVVNLLPQVRSIVAAPDDIARYVFPLEGNEAVQNLRYVDIPAQYAQVQRARALGQPVLVGPVKLVQGGQGIIQRTPVFLPATSAPAIGSAGKAQTGGRYWGVISVVADMELFMRAAGLTDHPSMRLAVFQLQADRQTIHAPIWGDPALATLATAVHQSVQLPGATWSIAAAPGAAQAWRSNAYGAEFFASLMGSAALGGLAALAVYRRRLLLHKNRLLAQQIEQSLRTQADLEAAQSRFKSLTELSADWVWEQDENFLFTFTSRSTEEATQVSGPQLLGFKRWESPALAPGTDWAAHIASVERHQPFRNFEYAQYAEDGSLRYVSISGRAFFDAQGHFKGYRGTGRNITESKMAERDLRESKAALTLALDRLQAVLDAAQEFSIIATDLAGRVSLFNRGAEQMLGYAQAEMVGQSPAFLHLASEVEARSAELSESYGRPIKGFDVFVEVPRASGSETRVWTYVRRDGSHLEVSLTVSLVRSQSGEPSGYLGIARDITAQRLAQRQLADLNADLESRVESRTAELKQAQSVLSQAKEELLRSEKMAALGSLVAGIAHELNTPLGNCLTTASTLEELTLQIRRSFEGGQMRRSVLEAYLNDAHTASSIMLRSMATANELVAHFKQISVDQTSAQRRSFALQSVIDDVLSLLRNQLRKASIEVRVEVTMAQDLDSFPGPLGQVLTNLILNASLHAFEAKPADARISIHARAEDERFFSLTVEDNGCGMKAEVRRRAFDPFFTTKMGAGGTGLGLNIVYNIVTGILGGQIELHSEPGMGSHFVMRLPFVAPLVVP